MSGERRFRTFTPSPRNGEVRHQSRRSPRPRYRPPGPIRENQRSTVQSPRRQSLRSPGVVPVIGDLRAPHRAPGKARRLAFPAFSGRRASSRARSSSGDSTLRSTSSDLRGRRPARVPLLQCRGGGAVVEAGAHRLNNRMLSIHALLVSALEQLDNRYP
jgi:hypothetical protein